MLHTPILPIQSSDKMKLMGKVKKLQVDSLLFEGPIAKPYTEAGADNFELTINVEIHLHSYNCFSSVGNLILFDIVDWLNIY